MTSRSLSSENRRHRPACIFISIFYAFMHIFSFVIILQNIIQGKDSPAEKVEAVLFAAGPNFSVMVALLFMAFVMAYSGFNYLHNKQQIDYYHALPVTRSKWFHIINANTIKTFLLFLMIDLAAQGGIGFFYGFGSMELAIALVLSLILYTLVFLFMYYTCVLAITLTGNFATSVLGIGVFCGYAPLFIRYLFPAYAGAFFPTYVGDSNPLKFLNYISPLTMWMNFDQNNSVVFGHNLMGARWFNMINLKVAGAYILAILLVSLLARAFFLKRASEAAGNSMAFGFTKPIIKYLIAVPAALYVGLFVYELIIASKSYWLYVGIVIGAIIVHGLIESIYLSDLRGMWCKPLGFLLTCILAIGISTIFTEDLLHYNDWFPSSVELNSAVVKPGYFNDYFFWGTYTDGLDNEEADAFIDELKAVLPKGQTLSENDDFYETINVEYHLASGGPKNRSYALNKDAYEKLLTTLFEKQDFRKTLFSIYSCDYNKITGMNLISLGDFDELVLAKDERAELLDLYLEEFDQMTLDDLRTTPIINAIYVDHEEEVNNRIKYSDTMDILPIYSTFAKTSAYLKEKGHDVDCGLSSKEITAITYDTYNESTDSWDSNTVTDEAMIEKVKDALIPCSYYDSSILNNLLYKKAETVNVKYKAGSKIGSIDCNVSPETLKELSGSIKK